MLVSFFHDNYKLYYKELTYTWGNLGVSAFSVEKYFFRFSYSRLFKNPKGKC